MIGVVAGWLAIAAVSLRVPPDADVVAVAFPPWWDSQQVITAASSAGASIVRTSSLQSLLVVRPDRDDGSTKLKRAGVWIMLNPQAVAACL